jgi:uncharacterized protein (DUF433 family)
MKMDESILNRIAAAPEIGGKPIIRGMRSSVELILSLHTQGRLAGLRGQPEQSRHPDVA